MEGEENDNNIQATTNENQSRDHKFEISGPTDKVPWICSCILSAIKYMWPTCSKEEMKDVLITRTKRHTCIKDAYENLKKHAEERKYLQQKIIGSNGQTVFQTAWPNTTNRTATHNMLFDIVQFIDTLNINRNDNNYFQSLLINRGENETCTLQIFCNVKELLKTEKLLNAVSKATEYANAANEKMTDLNYKMHQTDQTLSMGNIEKFANSLIENFNNQLKIERQEHAAKIKALTDNHEETVKMLLKNIKKNTIQQSLPNTQVTRITQNNTQNITGSITSNTQNTSNRMNQPSNTQDLAPNNRPTTNPQQDTANSTSTTNRSEQQQQQQPSQNNQTNNNNQETMDFRPAYARAARRNTRRPITGSSKTVTPALNQNRKHENYRLIVKSTKRDLKKADIEKASESWPFYLNERGEKTLKIICMDDSQTMKKFYVESICYQNPKSNKSWFPSDCIVEDYNGRSEPQEYTDKKATLRLAVYDLDKFLGTGKFVQKNGSEMNGIPDDIIQEFHKIYSNVDVEQSHFIPILEKGTKVWRGKTGFVRLVSSTHEMTENLNGGTMFRWSFWTGRNPSNEVKSSSTNQNTANKTYSIGDAQNEKRRNLKNQKINKNNKSRNNNNNQNNSNS